VDAPLAGLLHELRVEVPGVDRNAPAVRVGDEGAHLVAVGLGLGEVVVQRDVDLVLDRLVRRDLGYHDTVAVRVEHARDTGDHDVVVVDERNPDRGGHVPTLYLPRGVVLPP
jgi:hypothetical protein